MMKKSNNRISNNKIVAFSYLIVIEDKLEKDKCSPNFFSRLKKVHDGSFVLLDNRYFYLLKVTEKIVRLFVDTDYSSITVHSNNFNIRKGMILKLKRNQYSFTINIIHNGKETREGFLPFGSIRVLEKTPFFQKIR